MNMRTEIRGLGELQKGLDDLKKKQIPYALARALNDSAYGAMMNERKEIADSFDRPTPFAQRGVLYVKATAQKLASFVRVSDKRDRMDVSRVLAPHVYGGGRGIKASERRLMRTGAMGSGQWVVPGPGAPVDKYGNISGGQMQRILGFAQQYFESGFNKTRKTAGHYVIPYVGIFKRTGKNKSVPVLFFTHSAPQYEKRFAFHDAARFFFDKNFLPNMNKAWNETITASLARKI
jgi:hypothetical protein